MQVSITIGRSDDWVKEQRLANGSNVPEKITRPVDLQSLSIESRKILLEYGSGSYDESYDGFRYSYPSFTINRWGGEKLYPMIDSQAPTTAEIDSEIRRLPVRLAGFIEEKRKKETDSELDSLRKKCDKLLEQTVRQGHEITRLQTELLAAQAQKLVKKPVK